MKKQEKRWTLIADGKLQSRICLRVFFYWVACQCAVAVAIFSMATLQGSAEAETVMKLLLPAMLASMLVLPIALFDLLAFSNRFVGPITQLRTKMDTLANKGNAETVKFRKGDYYATLAEDFNKVIEKIKIEDNPAEISQPEPEAAEAISV